MLKDILLVFFYWLVFQILIRKFSFLQFRGYKTWVTQLLFNAKFVAGVFIWLVYTFYYTNTANNDVHKFYNNALALQQISFEDPEAFVDLFFTGETTERVNLEQLKNWNRNFDESPFNANRFMIRLNTILLFVSFKTYLVHVLFFCFFSLIGWVLLVNAVFSRTDQRNLILLLPVLFMPSVLFWNSGVMKEPLQVLGLGMGVSGVIRMADKFSVKALLSVMAGSILLLLSKYFVVLCLVPAAFSYLMFSGKSSHKFVIMKYAAVYLGFTLLALNIQHVLPGLDFKQMLVNKYTHAIKEAQYFEAGSLIEIPELKATVASISIAAVGGVWNMLSRPYPAHAANAMQLMCMLENLIMLSVFMITLMVIDWKNLQQLNLMLFCLGTAISCLALIGICTPVVGNMVRYKAPLLPLLYMAFAVAVTPGQVAANFSFLLRKN